MWLLQVMGLHIPVLLAAICSILLFKMRSHSRCKDTSSGWYKLQIQARSRDLGKHQSLLPNLSLAKLDYCCLLAKRQVYKQLLKSYLPFEQLVASHPQNAV